jgi:hypothetical protein
MEKYMSSTINETDLKNPIVASAELDALHEELQLSTALYVEGIAVTPQALGGFTVGTDHLDFITLLSKWSLKYDRAH